MSQEANMRRVTAIKNGTVIDHVPAGKALSVLKMLGMKVICLIQSLLL